jgi:glycosyltransferase involved in cell wall biosynthesis
VTGRARRLRGPAGTSGGREVVDAVVVGGDVLVVADAGEDAAVVAAELVDGAGVLGAVTAGALVAVWVEDPPHAAGARHASHADSAAQRRRGVIARSIEATAAPSRGTLARHHERVATALLTTYLTDYRLPLYRLLARRYDIEVLCYGGGDRYVPAWFTDLDAQLAAADFPARRLDGLGEALRLGRDHDAIIAPFAGGALLPAAYAGARRYAAPFVFWASIWHQPRSVAHALALPVSRHIYRHADAVVAYGEHARRFVARTRGRDDDIFVAPQSVEPELFRRMVSADEVAAFRAASRLGDAPLVLYVGRLVAEKGIDVLADAWPLVGAGATLVVIGDGPLSARVAALDRTRILGPRTRASLAVAYAASEFALLPSIPTPRFREPWGLVCNEAMHQGRPVIATTAVGAVAGGLVRNDDTGLVIFPNDPRALASAIDRLLGNPTLRDRLGAAARAASALYTYEAMSDAFGRALATAGVG